MIIECQACHARFRLDESRIKGRGARVRCRKCGDSIVVLKGGGAPPPPPEENGFFDLGSAVRDSAGEGPVSAPPAGNLIPFPAPSRPAEPAAPEPFGSSPGAATPGGDELDLAFGRVFSGGTVASSPSMGETEAEVPSPEPPAGAAADREPPAAPVDRPDFDFGGLILDLGPEEKLDLPSPEPEPPVGEAPAVPPSGGFRAEGGFLISDSDALDFLQEKYREGGAEPPPAPVGDISLEISSAPADEAGSFLREPDTDSFPREPAASASPRDDWASPSPGEISVEGNVTPPPAETTVDTPPYREAEPAPGPPVEPAEHGGSAARETARPRTSAVPAVAAVAAVLLATVGYFGFTTSGRKTLERAVPGIAALWGGGAAAPESPRYDLRNVIGYYESGSASPRILVIKGQVANLSKVEKSGIRIQATLLDNTDGVLAQQSVFAGNVLSGEAIRKEGRDTLSKALENRFGTGLANMNVGPGKAIPFMVVFFDAPANMDSYRLEAKDSE